MQTTSQRRGSIEPEAAEDAQASVEKPKGHKRAFSSAQPHRFKVKKYVKKWDLGNPRYAAEKAPSQMGLLCGQRTRPKGFAEPTPSELNMFYK